MIRFSVLHISAISSLVLFHLVFSGCSGSLRRSTVESLEEFHEEGYRHFYKGEYKEAVDSWLQELELVPNSAKTRNNIGIAYRYLGDLKAAVRYHEEAVALAPRFGHAYYSLGLANYDLMDYEKARDSFHKAIEMKYDTAEVYFGLGQALKMAGDCGHAIDAYNKVIEKRGSFPYVHYNIGYCYRVLGKIDDAKKEFSKEDDINMLMAQLSRIDTLEKDIISLPGDEDTLFELGMAYLDLNEESWTEKAMSAFEEVVKLNPSYKDAHFQLGKLYEKAGNYPKAEEEYRKELEFYPGSDKAKEALEELVKKMGTDENEDH